MLSIALLKINRWDFHIPHAEVACLFFFFNCVVFLIFIPAAYRARSLACASPVSAQAVPGAAEPGQGEAGRGDGGAGGGVQGPAGHSAAQHAAAH